ncbi:MAG: hypothetical protein ACXWBP_06995, partial [Limisphaerales bacterium]
MKHGMPDLPQRIEILQKAAFVRERRSTHSASCDGDLWHVCLVPRIRDFDKVGVDPRAETEGNVQFREQGWSGIEKIELVVIVALATLLLYLMVM